MTFHGEIVGDESCPSAALLAETCEYEDITPHYPTRMITQTGGIWSPGLTPVRVSDDKLVVGTMNEGYALDPQALSELGPLECFGSTPEGPVTQIWSDSIHIQVCTSRPQKSESH